MRKKIAVYANGWNNEILDRIIAGMRMAEGSEDLDIFVFVSYATEGNLKMEIQGEECIYDLPDMKDFDGVVVLSNNLHSQETAKKLCNRARESKVPAISVGIEMDGISYIAIDNETGMRELVNHLVKDHSVKRIIYIGGTPDHPDSVERLEITRSVLEENGLSLDKEDIFYGHWGYSPVIRYVRNLINSPEGLPDAIVCANDFTALAAGAAILENGLSIPDDCIITGFDSINVGKTFYPSLTSVENDFESIGRLSCEHLLSQAASGKFVPTKMKAKSRMVVCESCCKSKEVIYEKVRRDFCTQYYGNNLRNDLIQRNESEIEYHIVSATDFNSLKVTLHDFYRVNHLIEGDNFYLLLDPMLLQNILEDYSKVWEEGVRDEFADVLSITDGNVLLSYSDSTVDRHELIPGYAKKKKAHTYFLIGLHWEQYYIGHVIFVDYPWIIKQNAAFLYCASIRQALHSLRVNRRLDTLNQNLYALYNKDAMTGLYNRFGYESLAVPLFEQQRMINNPVMVCFLDINNMKLINDKYGHLQGDMAIAVVANAIKYYERDNWIGIRYGGDEFLLIASCADEKEAENIQSNILKTVKETALSKQLPYDLKVSCGHVLTDPSTPTTLQEYIKKADDIMYEIKRKLHEADSK